LEPERIDMRGLRCADRWLLHDWNRRPANTPDVEGRPPRERQEPGGGAATTGVEQRRLAPDAGEELPLAIPLLGACERPADTRHRMPIAAAQLRERGLATGRDLPQQLGVARTHGRPRPVRRSSEWLSCHRPSERARYMCILPLAMFGCPFGLTISQ